MNGTPLVRLSGLAKDYGEVRAVHPLDLAFEDGDFLAILGPSGCGKTTLLRMLGGFVEPSAGRIEIAGQDVTALAPEKRPTNMVFQGYGLFPHMSVRQNIGYGLRLRGLPRAEVDARVEEMIALVRLEAFAARPPSALSGGQQQRVALARALIMKPKVLLLDEPFAALDLKLRQALQDELRALHRKTGGTFVFVTHDQTEAMALANRIVVMEKGRVVQVGSAEDIYLRPASHFVSTFVGEANFLAATRAGDTVAIAGAFSFHAPGAPGQVEVGIRPERVRLGAAAETAEHRFRGRITDRLFLGAQVQYTVALDGGAAFTAVSGDAALAAGQDIAVGWNGADQWVVAQ
ncbi:MAG: ABC transporter ATP-binding protein [Proteobacteria bacterium]|nr:ABC transporter ATP-binding protein [Pseudomonadota bacterium]MBS0573748.1 ABC transporter ATP-binding protein [Pseudomonadota bacterium]